MADGLTLIKGNALDDYLDSLSGDIVGPDNAKSPFTKGMGHVINTGGISGRALLVHHNNAVGLIYRLKDTRPILKDERDFWAGQMAGLLDAGYTFDYVTTPPDSGKVPIAEHLGSALARAVATAISVPFRRVFTNPTPRGHRALAQNKLEERYMAPYYFSGDAGSVLIVDDVVHTRSTAMRCLDALAGHDVSPYFLFLYRA